MLNLTWVRTFVALVEAESFQGAARRLQLAQPTVSAQLRKLEEQLGVLLLRRGRVRCEPTAAAARFLPYARSLLRLSDSAIGAVKDGLTRVGASSNIGIYMLPPYIRGFLDGRDPRCFDMVIDSNPAIARKLEDGEIEVALMEWWDDREGFEAHLWRREPVVLIAPPSHPLASRSSIERDELLELDLLGGEPGSGTGRLLQTYFGGGAKGPRVSLQLGSTEAVKQAVKAGLGVSLVLRSTVMDEVRHGRLNVIPIADPPLAKDLFVIWRRSGVRHLAPPSFVRHLIGAAAA